VADAGIHEPSKLAGDEPPAAPDAESEWVVSGSEESIPLLIRYLRGQHVVSQRMALREFAAMGPKARPAVPAILAVLNDPKSQLRVWAAATLIHIGVETDAAVHTLMTELQGKDAAARAGAAWTIGDLVNPEEWLGTDCWGPGPPPRVPRPWLGKLAWPALLKALKDPAAEVRSAAAYSLGRIGADAKADVPALTGALEDKEADVREAAGIALGDVGPAAKAATPALVRALKDRQGTVALAAAQALQRLDPDAFVRSALPVLIAIIRDKDSEVRDKAVFALGKLGPPEKAAVPPLCELLVDGDPYVRRAAARGLSAIGPEAKAAIPLLIGALRDRDPNVRGMAAYALGSMGPEATAAVPALVAALTDDDGGVRSRAAYALGGVGPKARAAVPTLLAALGNKEDEYIHWGAAFALGRIGGDPEVVVPALVVALRHKQQEVRAAAASALGEFGDQAKPALPALIERLKNDDDWSAREKVAQAVKQMGPQAVDTATSALIEALDNQNVTVRRTAAFSLGMVDGEGKSIAALVRMLREDASARYAAARALGMMGAKAKSAIPALVEALRDKRDGVRAEAAEALQKIEPGTGAGDRGR
jgi:HEAT repeat protein